MVESSGKGGHSQSLVEQDIEVQNLPIPSLRFFITVYIDTRLSYEGRTHTPFKC